MSKNRILFVVPSLRRAGAEAQAVSLINGLPAADFDKHLAYYQPDSELAADVDAESVRVHPLTKTRKLDFSLIRQLAALIDKHRIDVVHCTLQNALIFGWAARRHTRNKPELICALHTTKNVDLKHEIADRFVHKPMLKSCAQVWFVCHTQADVWNRRMPFLESRARVVYNGIDADYFSRTALVDSEAAFRQMLGLDHDAKLVSCIAGFRPEKGHLLLLEAFQRVASKHTQAVLVLAGRGAEEDRVRGRVNELGIDDRVVFAGEIDDVRPLLADSVCKVIASTAVETFSIAMLEAMAMQVPVISSRIGGAAEAIEQGKNGILFEPGDVDAMSDALDLLLGDESLCQNMGSNARQQVVSKFTDAKMVELSAQYLLQLQGPAGEDKL